MKTYWSSVPWSSVYGQWGCTVSDVQISYHGTDGDWGSAGTHMSYVASCPSTVTSMDKVGLVESKSAALATATKAASPNSVPGACSGGQGSNLICVQMPSTGDLEGGNDNLTSDTETGHVRLGKVGSGACGLGTFITNGPDVTIGYSQIAHASATINQDSEYSARFYDPSLAASVCATM